MSIYIQAIYENDDIDVQSPIAVNNIGYSKYTTVNHQVNRPKGRHDYQILYVKSGCGYFDIDGITHQVAAEHVVIYHPHEPQHYVYHASDNIEVYWIHFGGTDAKKILESFGMNEKRIFDFSGNSLFQSTLEHIMKEMRNKQPYHDTFSVTYLMRLLAAIGRTIATEDIPPETAVMNEILEYISDNYDVDTSVEKYAELCNMSVSSFFRCFKNATGTSPLAYRTELRIKAAMSMLANSGFSVSQIASLVGYTDSLYFSRIFKKSTGLSPSQYRAKYTS